MARIQKAAPAAPAATKAAQDERQRFQKPDAEPGEGEVLIRCTSSRRPWTDKKRLELGEFAIVSADVAEALVDNDLAEVL